MDLRSMKIFGGILFIAIFFICLLSYYWISEQAPSVFIPQQLQQDANPSCAAPTRDRIFDAPDFCQINNVTCRSDFCAEFKPPVKDLQILNLNPKEDSCPIAYTDEQLINMCRQNVPFYKPKQDENVHLVVPPFVIPENDAETQRLQKKYEERVKEKHQCTMAKGMWGNPFNSRCTVVIAGVMGQYRRGQLVLDLGTGCGHQATFMTQVFGVRVFGIDLNGAAIGWARDHSVGDFHQTNGQNLSWIPDQTFDHVYSFGVVHYVPLEDVCHFSHEILRILKPGGTAQS